MSMAMSSFERLFKTFIDDESYKYKSSLCNSSYFSVCIILFNHIIFMFFMKQKNMFSNKNFEDTLKLRDLLKLGLTFCHSKLATVC